ncbi:MAG: ABC transporter substrate-binding protein [Proteobacteria bacterium]|nr:ABC transporter substrate-binding protein [Pseudomonadota bacterium]
MSAPNGPDTPPSDRPASRRRRTVPAMIGSLAAVLLVLAGPGTADAQAATEGAQRLVEAALHDTAQVFSQGQLSRAEATEQLRGLLDHYVDLPRVGRDSLGTHWRRATPEQQATFLALFESFVCAGYSGPIAKLGGALQFGPTAVVEHDGAVTVVRTDVQLSEGPRHAVLFMVGRSDDGAYRINDVVAAAISMSKLLSADFAGVLHTNGGQFNALIEALEHKLAVSAP